MTGGPDETRIMCDPDAGPICPRLREARDQVDLQRHLRKEYEEISAIKIFSAFFGVVSFLLIAIILSIVVDNHPLPILSNFIDKYASETKNIVRVRWLTTLFGLGIFLHYWRIFCGLSYAEHSDARPENITEIKLLFERLSRIMFLVTYPILSALLKTEYVNLVLLLWAAQTFLMVFYDSVFWSYIWQNFSKGYGFAVTNDCITLAIIAVYWRSGDIEAVTESSDAAIWILAAFTVVAIGVGLVETFTVYRRGLYLNFVQVGGYISGR